MKIYVWGTGFAAADLLENELGNIEIEAFIDNDVHKSAMHAGGGKTGHHT